MVLALVVTFPLILILRDPSIGLPVAIGRDGRRRLSPQDPALQALAPCRSASSIIRSIRPSSTPRPWSRKPEPPPTSSSRLEKQRVATARDEALAKAKSKRPRPSPTPKANRDERLRVINEVYARAKLETQTKLAREMREAVELHDRRMGEIPAQHEASVRKLEEKYKALKDKIRTHHEAGWNAMANAWRDGMTAAQATLDRVEARGRRLRPPLGRPVLVRSRVPQSGPAPVPDRRDPSRTPRPTRRRLDRPPPDGRDRHPLRLPRRAPIPRSGQPARRGASRRPIGGPRGAPGERCSGC